MAAFSNTRPVAAYALAPGDYAAYVPRLLDEPWDGARIVAASVASCELTGFLALAGSAQDPVPLADLFAIAEAHGGDVLSFGGDFVRVLFTGEGRHGRAINAVYAMHEALPAGLSMCAGVASGLVHLVTTGIDPRQLIAVGPAISRALELATVADAGETRSETVDRSAVETQGTPVAWPSSDFLAPSLRAAIQAPAHPEQRPATIGVGVFSGVDLALQRNPSRAIEQIAAVVSAVQRATAVFGVTMLGNDVAQSGGRFILAAGVPGVTDDGEERMILTAKTAVEDGAPFALRFGIATGDVLAGGLGGSTRRTYTVTGATVDLASRLAASAAPGEVLTTHRAIDRATTRYAISEWEPVTFQGMEAQVVPVVVGEELASGDLEGGFVGRSGERAILTRALADLEHSRGGVVDIVGEAGVGKSRLVTEALRSTEISSVVVRCEEYRQDIPYGAASRLLRAAMGIEDHEDPRRVGVLLRAQVRDLTPYLEPWLPLLAEVIDADVERTATVDEVDDSFRRLLTQSVTSQFAVWLSRAPIVVRIEDAHWMDAASVGLLSYVLARGADLPWLVVSTRRPDTSGWIPGDVLDAKQIDLEPLAPGASVALLTELCRDDPLPPDVIRKVTKRSGGNPLFLEALAAIAQPARKKLPKSIDSAIARQMERLPAAERKVLLEASVLGRRFAPELAAEVLGPFDWTTLSDHVEREWDGVLNFRQGAVQEAAYRGLPAQRRRELHEQAALTLEALSARRELLSLHFHRALDHERSWGYANMAGRRALERSAAVEAATLLDRAVTSARKLPSPPKELAEAAEMLGDSYDLAGRFDEADRAYVAAADLVNLKRARTRLLWKRASLRRSQGQYPAALRMLTMAMKSLPSRTGPGERAELELAYARVRLQQGRYRDAIERSDLSIPLAKRAGDQAALGHAHFIRGRALPYLEPGSGAEDLSLALDSFEETGDHLMQARVLNILGVESYRRGRWDEALTYQRRNAEQRDLAGDIVGAAGASLNRALVLVDQGKLDDAKEELEQVLASCRATGYRFGIARSTMALANIVARSGDAAPALGTLEETLELLEDLGAEDCAMANRLAQAETHLLDGDVEAALTTADEAIELAEGFDGVVVPLIGLLRVRGIALVWLGRSQEGRVELIDALATAGNAEVPFEEALISDALATLYGDDDAADRRDAIVERLGIVKLPPFLTPG